MHQANSPDIYDAPPKGHFYSPFNIAIDHMKKLMLVNFDGDPEYDGLELQTFDHPVKGTGAAVLIYRYDRKVDVYFQPGVHLDKKMYAVGAGLGAWVETQFEYCFEVTSAGLDASLRMEDQSGKQIEFRIKESGQSRRPFDLLAPLGAGIDNPLYFPFFYLRRFDLVRQSGTKIMVRIGGEEREPQKIPVPLPATGSPVYLSRYSTDPIIGTWNPAYNGELSPIQPEGAGESKIEDKVYYLLSHQGHYEIGKIYALDPMHQITLTFSPAIPDLECLKDGVATKGGFSAGADDVSDVLAGEYQIRREGSRVNMTLQPTENWRPRGGIGVKLTLVLFPPAFRTWPTTYRWSASMDFGDDRATMQSAWTRAEEID